MNVEANTRSPAAAAGVDETGLIAGIIIAIVFTLLLIIIVVGLIFYCRSLSVDSFRCHFVSFITGPPTHSFACWHLSLSSVVICHCL